MNLPSGLGSVTIGAGTGGGSGKITFPGLGGLEVAATSDAATISVPGAGSVTVSGGTVSGSVNLPGGLVLSGVSNGKVTLSGLPGGAIITTGPGGTSLSMPGGHAIQISGSGVISMSVPHGAGAVLSDAVDAIGRLLGLPSVGNVRAAVVPQGPYPIIWESAAGLELGNRPLGVYDLGITTDERAQPAPGNIVWITVTVQPRVETLTVATAATTHPQQRQRRKVGIGEEVDIAVTSPAGAIVAWSISGGQGAVTRLPTQGQNQGRFTASDHEETVQIEGVVTNFNNVRVLVEFEVVTPKTVTFELPGQGAWIHADDFNRMITVNLYPYFYYGPDDVCFYNAEPGETAAAPGVSGWFEEVDPQPAEWTHEAWDGGNAFLQEVVAGKGTKAVGWDEAVMYAREPPLINQVGRFEWKLKWKYRLRGVPEHTVGTPFYDVTQWMEIIHAAGGQPNVNGFTGKGGKGNATLLPE